MKFNEKYYYMKFSKSENPLNSFQRKKLENILYNEKYDFFINDNNQNYLVLYNNKLIGFLSFSIEKHTIEITCLYIFKECRNKDIGRKIINDLIFAAKYNIQKEITYIITNSFTESALFFLKCGFDFCKINKKLYYKKKNIIVMYKKI